METTVWVNLTVHLSNAIFQSINYPAWECFDAKHKFIIFCILRKLENGDKLRNQHSKCSYSLYFFQLISELIKKKYQKNLFCVQSEFNINLYWYAIVSPSSVDSARVDRSYLVDENRKIYFCQKIDDKIHLQMFFSFY